MPPLRPGRLPKLCATGEGRKGARVAAKGGYPSGLHRRWRTKLQAAKERQMMRESMCDSCMKPGQCCKSVFLTGGPFGEPMSFEKAEHELLRWRLPFRPLEYREDEHRWRFWCPNLQRDGRCGDYENRPALCRDYRPGQEGLCVHFWAMEGEALPI